VALGYSDKEAALALKALPKDASVSDGIKLALKALANWRKVRGAWFPFLTVLPMLLTLNYLGDAGFDFAAARGLGGLVEPELVSALAGDAGRYNAFNFLSLWGGLGFGTVGLIIGFWFGRSRVMDEDSGVDLLALGQHLHELRDAPRAGLGLLRALRAEQHRVAVARVQRGEELRGLLVRIERGLQVGRHGGHARGVVGRFPAPVGLRALHLGQPGRLHAAFVDQLQRLVAVDLRPGAARVRGVKRCRKYCVVLSLLRCPSIQPWHSAISSASGWSTEAMPLAFFAMRSHTPAAWHGGASASASTRRRWRIRRRVIEDALCTLPLALFGSRRAHGTHQ
jgi:hypothetical protein